MTAKAVISRKRLFLLLDRVLQSFGSPKLRHFHRLDLDGRACTRIAAHAASAGLRLEDTEARDGNLLAALELVGDHHDDRFDCALCIGFCEPIVCATFSTKSILFAIAIS